MNNLCENFKLKIISFQCTVNLKGMPCIEESDMIYSQRRTGKQTLQSSEKRLNLFQQSSLLSRWKEIEVPELLLTGLASRYGVNCAVTIITKIWSKQISLTIAII